MNNRPLSYKRLTRLDRFYYGSPYYPEHWDEATRASDPERMVAAGWNMVRMAEFAWDLMEPLPGQYSFSLFDQVIQRLGEKGIVTMLCTPTATPPRWLTYAFPEMLRVDANGVRMQHGSRQHACYSNHVLREHSKTITRMMADHYRQNPYVVGWQTDNEMNCQFPECHCESCQEAFREFLREKYHNDVQALNRAWGAQFWSQTYTDFDQIETPRVEKPTHPNPSQMLDYYRYISWSVTRFQHDQVEILRDFNARRTVKPDWFITHNGLFRHVDYRGQFTRDLDFIGYDVYPFFNHDAATRPSTQAFNLDVARAWSGNFIVPEQQSGPGGQSTYFHDTPEPGEMRRMAYTSIARGADSLMFFRWRTARYGAEEYWCGVIDHDSVPRRRYREAAQLGEELKRVGPALLGTHVYTSIGVAAADQEVTDDHNALTLGLPSPDEMAYQVHSYFQQRGYAVGVVHPSDDLSGLDLYILPHWALFNPEWLNNLTDYVNRGGVLIVGARTATRDLNNHVIAQTPPGVLSHLCGITVEEYGRQNAPEGRPLWLYLPSGEAQSKDWYEMLQPIKAQDEDVEVVATWKGRHLDGLPAVTARRAGKGVVIYVGTYLTHEVLEALFPEIEKHRAIRPLWPFAPRGMQVVKRQDDEKELWFFINDRDEPATIEKTPNEGVDLVTNQPVTGPLTLEPNGVAVIQTTRAATPGV